ncbi:UNKNOWN [Stylonychia lemnae]|uniref:Uncharacterized protein n=1 Tax=Stylonychia lemnae TaxID=5949 RepID=A0A078B9H6_STYLE|nr:UNKNOWN [Stylonychia lemnae]|eukprot:CDW91185.1 UNKNOWN [Stylonychia lemnae]
MKQRSSNLKYEFICVHICQIQNLHHEKQKAFNQINEQSIENVFEKKYQHYLKESLKKDSINIEFQNKLSYWSAQEELKVQSLIKEANKKRRNDIQKFQDFLQNISKILNENISPQSLHSTSQKGTELQPAKITVKEVEDISDQLQENPTVLMNPGIDDYDSLPYSTQNLSAYQQFFKRTGLSVLNLASDELNFLNTQENIKNILRENLHSQQNTQSQSRLSSTQYNTPKNFSNQVNKKRQLNRDDNKENILLLNNFRTNPNPLKKSVSKENIKTMGKPKKAAILVNSSSPGEKMEQSNKIQRVNNFIHNQNAMLRKILSPDITPPLSDEELDNNHHGLYQSECVRDTFENKEHDRINKPNAITQFKVKRQQVDEKQYSTNQSNKVDELLKELLQAIQIGIQQLSNKLRKMKAKTHNEKFKLDVGCFNQQFSLNETNEQIAQDLLRCSTASLTDKEAITQYFYKKLENSKPNNNVNVDDLLKVTFIENQDQDQSSLSCLRNVELGSQLQIQYIHTPDKQEEGEQIVLQTLSNEHQLYSENALNNAQSFSLMTEEKNGKHTYGQSFINILEDFKSQQEKSPQTYNTQNDQILFSQQKPNNQNMILACSPINLQQLHSGNISYNEDIKAFISNNDSQIFSVKRKLNMNKNAITEGLKTDLDDQSFMFGETFGNNNSRQQDDDEEHSQNIIMLRKQISNKSNYQDKLQIQSFLQNYNSISGGLINIEGKLDNDYSDSQSSVLSNNLVQQFNDQNINFQNFFVYQNCDDSSQLKISIRKSIAQPPSSRSNNRYINFESYMEIEEHDQSDREVDITCIVNPSFKEKQNQSQDEYGIASIKEDQKTSYVSCNVRNDSLDHSMIQTEHQILGISPNFSLKENINPNNFKAQSKILMFKRPLQGQNNNANQQL